MLLGTPLDQSLVEAPELLNEQNALQYRATVGVLMYLMICTRPDLAYRSFFVLCPALSTPLLLNACFGILPARKTSESPLSNPTLCLIPTFMGIAIRILLLI
jgi:hypothetical protein